MVVILKVLGTHGYTRLEALVHMSLPRDCPAGKVGQKTKESWGSVSKEENMPEDQQ